MVMVVVAMVMSLIMFSDPSHSAQCQTESAGLSLPWSVFEGSPGCEDQRLQHQPHCELTSALKITSQTLLTRLTVAEFRANILNIPNTHNNNEKYVHFQTLCIIWLHYELL